MVIHKHLTYSFDIDGVLADTAPRAIKLFNSRFNSNKKVSDLKRFYILMEWLKEILKDDAKALEEAVKIWNDEEVLSKSRPIRGSVEVVNELLAKRHEIHLITSRPGFTKEITLKWLQKWFPGIGNEFIHMSPDMNGLQRQFKSETIGMLKPDLHFEDSVEHIADILANSPATKIILVRQPWNFDHLSNLGLSVFIPKSKKRADIRASYNFYLESEEK